ncbi:hypothetical protein [Chromohalobacter japonicus]|uniref:hypothetical protein n=1 Tax=Chromohalobacter japonicus TaxID=223900 RepID=UPI001FF1E704|nr:hypothetical protein [Chromohalobacter japonicus]MCK0754035.1 hypothetical protein [Chromohalobacter japonicus]
MDIFNNRELASASLIILLLVWSSYKSRDVASSLKSVFDALFQRAIVATLASLLLYMSLVVYGLYKIEVWNIGQTKNTVLWFVFVGFAELINTSKIKDPKAHLQASLNAQVTLIVLVQFLVAFHSYSYIAELVLVAVLSLFACCSVYASYNPQHKREKVVFDILLALTMLYLLIDSIRAIYSKPVEFFSLDTFRDFLVPMLLSCALLPYTYCFYYYLAYERAFIKANIYTSSKSLRRYAKIQSFIAFKGRPEKINSWFLYSCIPEFESKETIRGSIRSFKQQRESTA